MVKRVYAGAAMVLLAGGIGVAKAESKKPCARIEFDAMPQLMRFGDTAHRDENRPFAKDPTVIRHNGRYLMYYSVSYDPKKYPRDKPNGKIRYWWGAVAESAEWLDFLESLMDRADMDEIAEILKKKDAVAGSKLMRKLLKGN